MLFLYTETCTELSKAMQIEYVNHFIIVIRESLQGTAQINYNNFDLNPIYLSLNLVYDDARSLYLTRGQNEIVLPRFYLNKSTLL